MLAVAITLALFALFDGVFLWLLAAASHSELQQRFPEYTRKVYRPSHQVITRQAGPVRLFTLIREAPPTPGHPAVLQMRIMASLFVLFAATSIAAWLIT